MMVKILLTSALVLGSALAHSAPTEDQAIANVIVSIFNLNNIRTAEPNKFGSQEGVTIIDNQAHLKANLGRVQVGLRSEPTLSFKNAQPLAITVNQRLLNELTQSGSVSTEDDGSLLMSMQAKNRLIFGAVNMAGIVEARRVFIQDGVVILSGQ